MRQQVFKCDICDGNSCQVIITEKDVATWDVEDHPNMCPFSPQESPIEALWVELKETDA